MAKVRNLHEAIARETTVDPSIAAHTARWLQNEGLLPVGRGGRYNNPEITEEHCVNFILGLSATPKLSAKMVRALATANTQLEDGRVGNIADTLLTLIRRRRDGKHQDAPGLLTEIIVSHDRPLPSVKLVWQPGDDPLHHVTWDFVVPLSDDEMTAYVKGPRPISFATVLDGGVIDICADVLGKLDKAEAAD